MEIKIRTAEEFHESHVTIEIRAEQGEVLDGSLSKVLTPGPKLYTDQEVADLQASESELVSKPLLARIRELEADRERSRADLEAAIHRAAQWDLDRHAEKNRADRLQAQLDDRTSKQHGTGGVYDRLLKAEERIHDLKVKIVKQSKDLVQAGERADRLQAELRESQAEAGNTRKWAETRTVELAREVSRLQVEIGESRKFRAQEREEARQQIDRLTDRLVAIRGRVYRPGVDDYLEDHDELARVIREVRSVLDEPTAETYVGA